MKSLHTAPAISDHWSNAIDDALPGHRLSLREKNAATHDARSALEAVKAASCVLVEDRWRRSSVWELQRNG